MCERRDREVEERKCRGAHTRAPAFTNSVTAHRQCLEWEHVFVCEENRSFQQSLAISCSPLHKPLSTTRPESFVQGSRRGSPALFVSAFMERYISASKLRWRKYGDRGEPADRYGHKGKRTVRGRFMDEAARSQSIMPAALPLHYGDTTHTHRLAGIYHMYCHWDREAESAGLCPTAVSTVTVPLCFVFCFLSGFLSWLLLYLYL